jgi:hypothetical protein
MVYFKSCSTHPSPASHPSIHIFPLQAPFPVQIYAHTRAHVSEALSLFLLGQNMFDIGFTILTILSVQFSGTEFIHIIVQPSSSSISQNCLTITT